VSFDADGFGNSTGRIRWSELVAVGIRTTAAGPFAEDLFWQFLLHDRMVALPGACVTGDAIRELHARLPGLDSAKIVEAMGSTSERIFRVWHAEESRTAWHADRFAIRFAALVARLGGSADASAETFARLHERWASPDRSYHGVEHLADCVRELDGAGAGAEIADVVELALWYHDAVYEPRRRDNEERSAELLFADAAVLGIPRATAEAAAALVRATEIGGPMQSTGDTATDLIRDVDLSILGRDVLRFMDYEYAVGEEYAHVPALCYQLGRGRFLASLLATPAIYRTAHFRRRYEERARFQIATLLSTQRYRSYRWLRWLKR
jgi:predicted metal-dependent HD superfamily phosphohydrolase